MKYFSLCSALIELAFRLENAFVASDVVSYLLLLKAYIDINHEK